MKPALAFLAWLALTGATFTMPAFSADTTGIARIPHAEYCAPSNRPLTSLAYVRVHARRQSPTWLAKRDSMLADTAAWSRYWPTVVAEAAEVTVSRTPVPAGESGKKYTFTPALNWRPAFVRVSVENAAGNASCPSNMMWVP